MKRLFDILLSAPAIIILSPVFVFLWIAVKFSSKGPAIFRQQRAGKDGRPFIFYKFRTMKLDAYPFGPSPKSADDPRLTKIGKFLRESSLDELPQLFNILRGDMKVIGPRPERPEFVRNFNHDLPMYVCRHYVKPGLTGWAQVMFQYAAGIDDTYKKLQYDLYYIKNKTVLLDLFILLRTVGVVLTGKGAR